jgi:hypothetical protein
LTIFAFLTLSNIYKLDMKKIFTLFVVFLALISNAQNIQKMQAPKKYKVEPGAFIPVPSRNSSLSARAGDTACSRISFNMPFTNLLWGQYAGYNLNGSWYSNPRDVNATTLSSYLIPSNDNNKFSITIHYDSMITQVYHRTSFEKVNKASSTLELDTLQIFGGIGVDDTNNLRPLVGDSFIISCFLSNNGVLGAKLFDSIYADTNRLRDLDIVFQKGFLGARSIPFKHKFNKGESFALKLMYKTTKPDNGMLISYQYVDSCGTIPFNSQQLSSPAVRNTMYSGMVKTENVDSTSPTTATIFNSANTFAYNIPGVSSNCLFIYEQHYYVIPYLTVCKELQGSIVFDKAFPCYKDQVIAYAVVSGGKAPYTYSWATPAGITLSSTSLDSAIFTMTRTGNLNFVVTVTDAGTNSITITRNLPNYTAGFASFTLVPNRSSLNTCVDTIRISVPSTSNTTYSWSGGAISSTNSVVARKPGAYNIQTTFGPSGCTFDTLINITSNFAIPTLDFSFTPATGICQNKTEVTFNVASSATKTGWNYTWADQSGALSTPAGTSVSHIFTSSGSRSVSLNADSSACKAVAVTKTVTVTASTAAACKVGINAVSLSDQISIYPNPVLTGSLHIDNNSSNVINVKMVDLLGKSSFNQSVNRNAIINLDNVSNGIYFVEIESKGERTIKKIVVDKQ